MSDPIAAPVAAVASNLSPMLDPANTATPTAFFYDPALSQSANEPGVASAFQNILKSFHSETAAYDAGKNKTLAAQAALDPVNASRASFYPQGDASSVSAINAEIAAQDPVASAANKQVAASEMLKSSFDHALFVTLVSQVVSGVGQTVSTLIKQQ